MPTALPPPASQDVFYIIDFSGYVFRAYHALPPMSTSTGEPVHAVYGVTQMLLSFLERQSPAMVALALDPGGPTFRKERYPEYKANRPPTPPDLKGQIKRLLEVMEAYRIPTFAEPGLEADDVIAALVGQAKSLGLKAVIVSADKDLLQLVDEDVVMYDTMRQKVFGPEETVAKFGVVPAQVRDFLALTGDSSDNIPGVPSVGPKTAAKLLNEYETLDGVYAAVDQIKRKALRGKLQEFRDQAYLSQELVTLKPEVSFEIARESISRCEANEDELRKLFTDLEFHRLLSRLTPKEDTKLHCETLLDVGALSELVAAAKEAGQLSLFTLAEEIDPSDGTPVGVALSVKPGVGAYVPLGHLYAGAESQPAASAVVELLRPILESAAVELWVADAKRERQLWARFGVELKAISFDAMLASYLADPERHDHTLTAVSRSELGLELTTLDILTEKKRGRRKALCDVSIEGATEFAGARAERLGRVREVLQGRLKSRGLNELLENVELPLSAVLGGMEVRGIELDVPLLAELSSAAKERITKLENQAEALVGRPFKISSPRALEAILFDELGLRVIKRTKTARSTDQSVLEQLCSDHDLPAVILKWRSLSKLVSTYLDALPKQVNPRTGRVHTKFNQAVAATGRISSSDPNLQNIPIRTEDGRAIRRAFVARDGWQLMSADYSQIELRVLAHLSADPLLVGAFQREEDVHQQTAEALFSVSAEEVTREMRGRAKTVNYAVIYGQTESALARNLSVPKEEALGYIEAFFKRYSGVQRYMDEVLEQARQSGGVHTVMGRFRTLPNIRSRNRGLRWAAERIARNTPIQGSAADLLKVAMLQVDAALQDLKSEMLLTVHDELLFEVAPGEEEQLKAIVIKEMENVMELQVPLRVSVGTGRTWASAH